MIRESDILVLLVALFSMVALTATSTWQISNSTMKLTDEAISCKLNSITFDAANALNVRWISHHDVITDTNDDVSAPALCLLRLGVLGTAPVDCDTLHPVTKARAVEGQHTFWNVSQPGKSYVICSRGYDGIDNDTRQGNWSYMTVSNDLRLPPVVNNCHVLIRNVSRRATAAIDTKPYYFFESSQSIRITCDVTGQPIPTIRWCKNSVDCYDDNIIQNGSQMIITSASLSDEGTYFMTSSNKYGRVRVGGFTLKMAVVKPLPQSASDIALDAGKSTHLPCHGWKNSVPAAKVTWHRIIDRRTQRRVPIVLSHRVALVDGSLIFVDTRAVDSGSYICRVTVEQLGDSQFGNVHEYKVTGYEAVNYPRPPERVDIDVLNNKRLVHGLVGSTAQLACMFTGNPHPTVAWYHNGLLFIANESRHQWSSDNQVLDISPVLLEDDGEYVCKAVNAHGSITTEMRLQVSSVPSIVSGPNSVNASSGATVSFRCDASGVPHPTISWFINGDEFANPVPGGKNNGRITVSGYTMTFLNVSASDVSVIQCKALNYYGYAMASGYLNVYEPTQVAQVSPGADLNITVDLNEDVINPVYLRCRATTDPLTNISITWNQSDPVGSCSVLDWQLTDHRNSSAKLKILPKSRLGSMAIPCCKNVSCLATNGLTDGRANDVRVCVTLAKDYSASESQSEPVFSAGTLSLTMSSIYLMIGGVGLVVIALLACTIICVVRRQVPSKRRQQLLQQSQQPLPLHQLHQHMVQTSSACCEAVTTCNRSHRLGSTSSECSAITMATGATYCGVHGANGRQTFGRAGTLSRQISAFSTADSTDCLVRENCSPMNGPLNHLNGPLQMAINEMFIARDRIRLEQAIGNGQFGRVFSAELEDARHKFREHVAVKTMKFKADETEMVELFLREAVIMKDFRHPNVLHILGVTFDCDNSPMVVLPFMANGDMRQYILNPRLNITILELLKLGLQVAEGMQYLSNLRFVHRDLAARNCMVTERRVVKVADFGLSRELLLRDYYRSDGCGMTPVPVRWLALECLENSVFTTMSDVWSFGVLLWELMTRGAVPYSEIDNWQIAAYVQNGKRLDQPEYCPDVIYELMRKCWNDNAEQRPTFSQLVQKIGEITTSAMRSGSSTNAALYQNVLGNANGPSNSLTSISSKKTNTVGHSNPTCSENEYTDDSGNMISLSSNQSFQLAPAILTELSHSASTLL